MPLPAIWASERDCPGESGLTEAERAALELTGQGTRLADAAGGVTDHAWDNAANHYDEDQFAALVSLISLIKVYNRMNVITRQPAREYQPGRRDSQRSWRTVIWAQR